MTAHGRPWGQLPRHGQQTPPRRPRSRAPMPPQEPWRPPCPIQQSFPSFTRKPFKSGNAPPMESAAAVSDREGHRRGSRASPPKAGRCRALCRPVFDDTRVKKSAALKVKVVDDVEHRTTAGKRCPEAAAACQKARVTDRLQEREGALSESSLKRAMSAPMHHRHAARWSPTNVETTPIVPASHGPQSAPYRKQNAPAFTIRGRNCR